MWITINDRRELVNLDRCYQILIHRNYLGGNIKDDNVKYLYIVTALCQKSEIELSRFYTDEEAKEYVYKLGNMLTNS